MKKLASYRKIIYKKSLDCCLKLDFYYCENDDYRIEHDDYGGFACLDCYFQWLGRVLKNELFYNNNKKLNFEKLEKIRVIVFDKK